jgi:hypothetical protein
MNQKITLSRQVDSNIEVGVGDPKRQVSTSTGGFYVKVDQTLVVDS